MIATIVNSIAVIAGSFLGLVFHKKVNENLQTVVYNGIGVTTLIIGMGMALKAQEPLYLALSLVIGGLTGELLNVEGLILRFGEFLKRHFAGKREKDDKKDFANAFLTSSVLFCVGAMALVGSFKAGVEKDYSLLFTKSVMDGFIAILLAAAMGTGVLFSALSILVYQGILTVLSVQVEPLVSVRILSELTGVGGALVIMIGLNMLNLKSIKTANFLPSLLLVVILVALEPVYTVIGSLFS